MRWSHFLLAAAIAASLGPWPAIAQAPVKAVASFSILADMVRNVGGEQVEVTTLVGPDGDAHVYQPSPADARAIAEAQVVVVNGFGFEGWMPRLISAAAFKGVTVVATQGVQPLAMGGGEFNAKAKTDPHAWQDLQRGMAYVNNIAAGLAAADPARAAHYRANADAYVARLRELDAWVVAELGRIPQDKRRVITAHRAFGYFAHRYGVTFSAPVGLSTAAEASAKDAAALIAQIRNEHIRAVFIENMSDPRLLQMIVHDAGAVIGGTLYADALSGPAGAAPTYIDMFRHNATELVTALR
jgi:zinc/manganese transport system substrate-binding protein